MEDSYHLHKLLFLLNVNSEPNVSAEINPDTETNLNTKPNVKAETNFNPKT